MDNHLVITFVILIAALLLFLTDKVPADLVALLVVVALGVSGVLTPQEAFSGFSRSAVITIIAIYVLAEALQRSGVTEQVGNILLRAGGKSELSLVVIVMAAGAFLSLFMNNIAAAAVLLPAASGAAKKAGVNSSRILMPLAFGTILGGMATLLTTSNIVLNSLLHDDQIEGFSLTDFFPVGSILIITGIAYVAFVGRRFLPGDSPLERTHAPNSAEHDDLVTAYGLGKNLFRAKVPDNSFLIGKRLVECTLREDFGVSVVAIERKGKRILDLSPDTKIRRADTLVLEGDESDFRRRDVQPYMEFLPAAEWTEGDLQSRVVEVVEAMLAPRSRLIGKTLRESHFREKYGMSVLAIWHGDQEIIIDMADVRLEFGDALLLQGSRERLAVLSDDPDIILLMSKEEAEITVPNKGLAAIMIFVATLAFAVSFPDLTGTIMLGGALAMLLTGIMTTEQAYASIGWKSVFLVAGMLPMGIALSKTNAASLMGAEVVDLLGSYGPMFLLGGMFIVTVGLTQAVNGAVSAAILGPVAIRVAQQAGINPRAMVMGVALATSMAFITPLSHPVNVLVMSPGGYNFRDYLKVGLPLVLILFVVVMIFLPVFWAL
ncbi:MAG TPA: SLC13 family permease [Pyrinomonadaceae bacterium]|nr:SLC13 family permease [Pyrinomonadaceae bacterium]